MNAADIFLIILIAAAVVGAVWLWIRNKRHGNGCCGDCGKCSRCAYGDSSPRKDTDKR